MKFRFNTLDIVSQLSELQFLIGMRVNKIYDIDSKTYLIKLHRSAEEKAVLLLESGVRFHTTRFEWPKNDAPSGFSMKLRKHLKNKRIECLKQLGVDRVVHLQFGMGDVANHVFLELYDRGNIVLTDHEYTILSILRPRVAGEDQKFIVKQTYPVESAKTSIPKIELSDLDKIFLEATPTEILKRTLVRHFEFGPPLLEHLLRLHDISPTSKVKNLINDNNSKNNIIRALNTASDFLQQNSPIGLIVTKTMSGSDLLTYEEFHSHFLLPISESSVSSTLIKFSTFNEAVDEFFSKIESQKIDVKALAAERQVYKKLENVKKDYNERLNKLKIEQAFDKRKGEIIELNHEIVEKTLHFIRSALAQQMNWREIQDIITESSNDPILSRIKGLRLESNHFSLSLSHPYEEEESQELLVDIDIDASAQANARKYYVARKNASRKEEKTLSSHAMALKSAERKTKSAIQDVAIIKNINKARKVYWFEKFFWFISSENYLVIGGRDMQQNELIVKRYMKSKDIYVHADVIGASSIVIKNTPEGDSIPPKTLNEAGVLAVCYSTLWENKLGASTAWWVHSSQVSKSAPTGEYLTVGSFMIRGKKNFLPSTNLVLGFGFLFKLEESSFFRHQNERRVKTLDEVEEMKQKQDEEIDIEIKEEKEDENEDENEDEKENEDEEEKDEKEEDEDEEQEKEDDDLEKEKIEDEEPDEEKEKEKKTMRKTQVGWKDSDQKNKEEKEFNNGDKHKESKLRFEEFEKSSVYKEIEFPDTRLKINFSSSGELTIKTHTHNDASTLRLRDKEEGLKGISSKLNSSNSTQNSQSSIIPRGQKSKLKKIKTKYADQEPEDRELIMKLLHGDKEKLATSTKKKYKKAAKALEKENAKKAAQERFKEKQLRIKDVNHSSKDILEENGDNEESENVVSTELDMLQYLTGTPFPEDELLFCIPVVAPYSVMATYKYKVKVSPGIGKKGKGTKMALALFTQDKNINAREKDLFKSVKDQDLARNLPGKVKISSAQLQKVKLKK